MLQRAQADALQRSNARPADANEQLALQTEQRRQKGSGG